MRVMTLLLVAGLGLTGRANAEAAKGLEGKWVIVSAERDGKADDNLKGAVRENKGGSYTLTLKQGKELQGTYTVNAAKKTMDMMPGEGRYKGKTLQGIYKLEGDTLTICFAEPGKDRPTEFASGPGVVLVVHKREAK